MTDYETDEIEDTDNAPHATLPVEDLRNLRAAAKGAKAAEAENQKLRQELAISRTGLDLSDTQIKALSAVHEGAWDAEAVKATAADLGFVKVQPQMDTAALQAMDRIAQASEGTSGETETDWDAEYSKANTEAEVLAIARRQGATFREDE